MELLIFLFHKLKLYNISYNYKTKFRAIVFDLKYNYKRYQSHFLYIPIKIA